MSYDQDYGPYHGHPQDPRTPEDNGREEWEAETPYTEYLADSAIDEILSELLHGNPETTKASLEKAVEAMYRIWVADQQRQAEEDRAADLAESRAWAREAA